MQTISLSNGAVSFIDDEDFNFISQHKWYLSNGYAINEKRQKMHRLILNASVNDLVDHADHDRLNNQKSNIRLATTFQNVHNQHKRKCTKNKFKGVNFCSRLNLYQSRCRINKGDHFLGYFTSEVAAAFAYNKKAIELSPSFIFLNVFNITNFELERKLIEDRVIRPIAAKQSNQKGVYWNKHKGGWEAIVFLNGLRINLGFFTSEIDAIRSITADEEMRKVWD